MRRVFRLSLLRPRDLDRDVDEELAFHLEMRESRLRASGLPPEEAARLARDRFGNVDGIRAECLREGRAHTRLERAMQLVEEARHDAHFAVRALLRAPSFAVAVVLTLALGVGANATIFSLIRAVVLQPVSGVRATEELFELGDVASYPAFRAMRETVPGVSLAGLSERRMALGHGTGVEHTAGALVSGNFFDVVGARVAVGRALFESDDVGGAPPVGVIAHEQWVRAYGADSGLIGRTLTVNGSPVTVVGVAARDFRGIHLGVEPAIWIPISAWSSVAPSSMRHSDIESVDWDWLRVVGRVGAGTTMGQAQRAIAGTLRAMMPGLRAEDLEVRSTTRPIQAAALAAGARESVVQFAGILAGVVALVLLTACANIAGLFLSRASYREREIAVRIALGAGRGRLVRQLLTESMVLAAAGAAAGLGVFLVVRAVLARTTLPGGIEGDSLRLVLDGSMLGFAAVATVVTGLLVGVAPALQSSRPDTVSALKGAGSKRGSRTRALRGALVTAQVAVGLALLVGTGLFSRALTRGFAVDLGYDAEHLVTMSVDPGLAQLDAPRAREYYAAAAARVAAMPGVRGVTWTAYPLLTSSMDRESATVDGYTPGAGERVMIETGAVGPRYHEVTGIPLSAGRGFDERDVAGRQPVIVVNETLAKRYFAGRDPVGSFVRMRGTSLQVVGVARDVRYHALNEEPRPYAYFPLLQLPGDGIGTPALVARVDGGVRQVLATIVEAARATNPAVPIFDATTMPERLREILAPQLAGAALLAVFSALALVVAAVGIHGIVAYAVSQRTREIGIRRALGAGSGSVVSLVVARNLVFVAIGIPIGLVLAVTLARGMTDFLFGVGSADLLTLAGTSALMVLVGLLASLIPARRAARIDPVLALRADA